MEVLFPDTGAEKIKKPFYFVSLLFFAIASALAIANKGPLIGAVLTIIPFVVYFLVRTFLEPKFGLILSFIFSFFAIGLTRYIDGIPFGLGVDLLLVLTIIALLLNSGKKLNWKNAGNDFTAVSAIWMGYTILEIVNPQAVSFQAWFYAMRGVAFYQLLMIPIGFLVLKEKKDLKIFLVAWLAISVLAALKAFQQIEIGPDKWENAWLDAGGALTHRIQGRLRAFSFYSDAGQLGAAMGHAALVAIIIALGKVGTRLRIILGVAAILTVLGMLYSGTRGALFVPVAGGMLYLFLSKNFKVFILGVVFAVGAFGFLRYTTIGNTNYQIFRLRTAVRPSQDRSFMVRLENQRKLKVYMADKPFGGGIGSAGNWGMRFSPNTFLAQTPTDSWYVRIWAEMGIVGLLLHITILMYLLIRCCLIVWKLRDPLIRQIMIALTSGIFGVMVASYGNGIYGQMPTGMIIYLSYVFVFLSPRLEAQNDDVSQ
jgi:hypothetical protein